MAFMQQSFTLLLAWGLAGMAHGGTLATMTTVAHAGESTFTAEGTIEAVKNSVIAAQVVGSVTTLTVKAGDHVSRGHLLVRIDPRLAEQQRLTNQAQLAAARAELANARNEWERKRRLFEKQYISRAAMDRAESDFQSAEAVANANLAQSGMAGVQSGMHVLNAPYAGVVATVMTEIGNMVMPDKPLLSIYDPHQMRVVANVPQNQLAGLKRGASAQIEIPGSATLSSRDFTVLPVADAVSHVVEVRVALPADTPGLTPGLFARVRFPLNDISGNGRIHVPLTAVVRRSELIAVYVADRNGRPQLRQVRLGQVLGSEIEIAAGLEAGERVILDPLAAARLQ